jgi:hypothetical protein
VAETLRSLFPQCVRDRGEAEDCERSMFTLPSAKGLETGRNGAGPGCGRGGMEEGDTGWLARFLREAAADLPAFTCLAFLPGLSELSHLDETACVDTSRREQEGERGAGGGDGGLRGEAERCVCLCVCVCVCVCGCLI